MYLKSIRVENYRLLKDVTISFDSSLTLFVGKNNTGKTSIMHVIEFLLSNATQLPFDDYPLECRQALYSAIESYWRSESENPITDFQQNVPITKVTMTIDYSDDNMGNVSSFVIDLDENVNHAIVQVSFNISPRIETILEACKKQFDDLTKDEPKAEVRDKYLKSIVRKFFSEFFTMNIVAVNPTNAEDILEKKKSDLQNSNPLGTIMRSLFSTELEEMQADIQQSMLAIQNLVIEANYNLQGRINEHMATIVQNMLPFGYPAADDMQLHANTNIDLERRIKDETVLTYVSKDATETLPSTHNGLGYKNLIKISLELNEYARMLQKDRTKLPLLFLEEPEAHMHPQLQTRFSDKGGW